MRKTVSGLTEKDKSKRFCRYHMPGLREKQQAALVKGLFLASKCKVQKRFRGARKSTSLRFLSEFYLPGETALCRFVGGRFKTLGPCFDPEARWRWDRSRRCRTFSKAKSRGLGEPPVGIELALCVLCSERGPVDLDSALCDECC